jgi:diguanylate cyclase (GGDEF) domain
MNLADAYSYAVSELINMYLSDLKTFSAADIFKSGSGGEINDWIRMHDDRRPQYFLTIYYADTKGNLISSTGLSANIKDRDYFKQIILEKNDTAVDGGTESRISGKLALHIARAVYDKNKECIGLIGGEVELTTIQNIVNKIKIGKNGYSFIINRNGEFISYPDENMLTLKNSSSISFNNIHSIDFIISRKSGYLQATSITGVPVSIAFKPISGTPLILGVCIPEEEVDDLYNSVMKIQLYIVAILIIGVLFGLSSEILILRKVNERNRKSAELDKLTGLYSRSKFDQLSQELIRKNPDKLFMYIDADIRGFKVLNQMYGTVRTDLMLVLFADCLKLVTQGFTGYIGRVYADRFSCLVEIDNEYAAMSVFRKKLKNVEKEIKKSDIVFYIKFGIAFSLKNEPGVSIQALAGRASFAKATIKNNLMYKYAVFTPEMQRQINEEQEIESCMEKALSNGEFFVIYQPKISLKTEKIIGAEALVRWRNPKFGVMAPAKFIPTFEKNGFIVDLDFYVYDMVFGFLQRELDAHRPVVPVSLNMSRNHTNPEQFISQFINLFEKYSIPPSLIEIEIIERTSETGKLMLLELTKLLHKHGFNVAMDDFGSGESSLNMLNTIPVDVIKFDQSFLNPGNYTEKTSGMITKLVELGKQLDKETVFEGVETKEQIDFLKSIQCDQVQGYYYSRPLCEDDFIAYIRDHI